MSTRIVRHDDNTAAQEKTATKRYEVYSRFDLAPVSNAAGTVADAKMLVDTSIGTFRHARINQDYNESVLLWESIGRITGK